MIRNERDVFVAHVLAGGLRPENRRASRLMAAQQSLERDAGEDGELYGLANGDIVVLADAELAESVMEGLHRVRHLFHLDPLVEPVADPDPADGRFVAVHYGAEELQAFLAAMRQAPEDAGTAPPPEPVPPTIAEAGKVLDAVRQLKPAALVSLLRRQPVIDLSARGTARILHFDMSVDLARFQAKARFDLSADKCLWRHLCQACDRPLIEALVKGADPERLSDLGVAVSLATAGATWFHGFAGHWQGRGRLVVEVPAAEALTDRGRLARVRAALADKGARLMLGGVTLEMLKVLDLEDVAEWDMLKLNWSDHTRSGGDAGINARIRALTASNGGREVILGGADGPGAVRWGMPLGIQGFQGGFVDGLVAKGLREKCAAAAECRLKSCLAPLRALGDDAGRLGCVEPRIADRMRSLAIGGRKPS